MASGFQDRVATGFGAGAVRGLLDRRAVAIVVMPGADEKVVGGLSTAVQDAGGTLTGQYAVAPAMLAPDGKSLVDTLGSQVAESVKDVDVPTEATTYDRMGQLIGRAMATTENAGDAPDGAAADILSSLSGAKLMSSPDEARRRASLVLVVLGSEPEDATGAANIYGGLVSGIAATLGRRGGHRFDRLRDRRAAAHPPGRRDVHREGVLGRLRPDRGRPPGRAAGPGPREVRRNPASTAPRAPTGPCPASDDSR